MAHCLEVAELLLRAASFFCGIITAASVKVAQVEFAGHCMLYGSVGYNATSKEFSVASSSNASLCLFVSVISGLITIYCFFVVLYCIYASCFSGVQGSSVEVTLSLAFAATFLFFLLISGCILNIGLTSLCQSITTAKDLKSPSQHGIPEHCTKLTEQESPCVQHTPAATNSIKAHLKKHSI
ncbi:transmembrane protein 179B-like isoform X2 [Polyodon spathula]|uniref:transmembrane protein 179B-like isoform X2 n=1 Tax=Polyodon spathula TaxID=7913 RepID=UPI001B7F60DD|nr:transmembrane protein 179B-like isoform X2 [Polyodon spathula]